MKWTTHELIKQYNQDNTIDVTLDLSPFIEGTDILAISPVHVTGEFEIYDNQEFVFYLTIKATLTLPCAITLKEVEYPIDLDVEEAFVSEPDDDSNRIEGITVDLLPIIWSNILLEKPMRVVSENAYDEVDYETTEIKEETTNAFADLKDYDN